MFGSWNMVTKLLNPTHLGALTRSHSVNARSSEMIIGTANRPTNPMIHGDNIK